MIIFLLFDHQSHIVTHKWLPFSQICDIYICVRTHNSSRIFKPNKFIIIVSNSSMLRWPYNDINNARKLVLGLWKWSHDIYTHRWSSQAGSNTNRYSKNNHRIYRILPDRTPLKHRPLYNRFWAVEKIHHVIPFLDGLKSYFSKN